MSAKKRSIAEKTAKLDELVAWFDSEEFELEKALDKFKEAETLAAEIEHDLMQMKNEVNVIKKRFDEQL
ncbi:MAG TPA: exodeoxyribonuclease VII small subunit [Candidatus Saccharimonadales bacterium]|nr:exodeoxyribonuclease VII small subunit [Candidatus Saccharimonadales bacterium]